MIDEPVWGSVCCDTYPLQEVWGHIVWRPARRLLFPDVEVEMQRCLLSHAVFSALFALLLNFISNIAHQNFSFLVFLLYLLSVQSVWREPTQGCDCKGLSQSFWYVAVNLNVHCATGLYSLTPQHWYVGLAGLAWPLFNFVSQASTHTCSAPVAVRHPELLPPAFSTHFS